MRLAAQSRAERQTLIVPTHLSPDDGERGERTDRERGRNCSRTQPHRREREEFTQRRERRPFHCRNTFRLALSLRRKHNRTGERKRGSGMQNLCAPFADGLAHLCKAAEFVATCAALRKVRGETLALSRIRFAVKVGDEFSGTLAFVRLLNFIHNSIVPCSNSDLRRFRAILFEPQAQLFERSVEPTLDRAQRHGERVGDLLKSQFLKFFHHDHFTQFRR